MTEEEKPGLNSSLASSITDDGDDKDFNEKAYFIFHSNIPNTISFSFN